MHLFLGKMNEMESLKMLIIILHNTNHVPLPNYSEMWWTQLSRLILDESFQQILSRQTCNIEKETFTTKDIASIFLKYCHFMKSNISLRFTYWCWQYKLLKQGFSWEVKRHHWYCSQRLDKSHMTRVMFRF